MERVTVRSRGEWTRDSLLSNLPHILHSVRTRKREKEGGSGTSKWEVFDRLARYIAVNAVS
jgi:hypothetical protein